MTYDLMNTVRRLGLLAALLSVSSFASAADGSNGAAGTVKQPEVWDEGKVYTVTDKAIIMHTHPATIWDNPSSCRKGNREFDRVLDSFYSQIPQGDARRLRRFLFVSDNPLNDDQYFLKAGDVPTIISSSGGAHNIRFPNIEEFTFSGGNFGACLCETVRDVIKGTELEKRDFTKKPLNMTFITDAIYCVVLKRPPGMPPEVVNTVDDNMAGIVKYSTNEELLKEVSRTMFNDTDDKICSKGSNGSNKLGYKDDPKMSNYTVIVVKGDTEIGRIGKGKQLIRAVFVTSEQYAAGLQKQNPGLALAQ